MTSIQLNGTCVEVTDPSKADSFIMTRVIGVTLTHPETGAKMEVLGSFHPFVFVIRGNKFEGKVDVSSIIQEAAIHILSEEKDSQ